MCGPHWSDWCRLPVNHTVSFGPGEYTYVVAALDYVGGVTPWLPITYAGIGFTVIQGYYNFTMKNDFNGGEFYVDGERYVGVPISGQTFNSTPNRQYTLLAVTPQWGTDGYKRYFWKWRKGMPFSDFATTLQTTSDPVTGDVTYEAKFRREFNVTVNAASYVEPGSGGTYKVNGTNVGSSWASTWIENLDTPITLEAVPPSGYFFACWSDGETANPRNLTPTNHVEGLHAIYKLPLHSTSSSATAPSNQRKVVNFGSTTHIVYQSGGCIWYTRNDGIGWGNEIPISISTTAKNPSIGTTSGPPLYVHIVWEDDRTVWYRRSTDGGFSWQPPKSIGYGGDNDATPVVSGCSYAIVAWKFFDGFLQEGIALMVEPSRVPTPSYHIAPNTDETSNSPSLICVTGPRFVYVHNQNKIMYQELSVNPNTFEITFGNSVELTSGYSFMTNCSNPSIATYINDQVFVTWDAMAGSARKVFLRERNSSGVWLNLIEFIHGTHNGTKPSIGVDYGLEKVTLIWECGTHIAKSSRPITNPTWSYVSDRGAGYSPSITSSVQSGNKPTGVWTSGSSAPYTLNVQTLDAPTMQSFTANVTAANSQRKLVRGSSGTLYLTYDSEGDIWFTKSTDNGTTWSVARYLSRGMTNCTYPAITERSGFIYVVWQRENGYYDIVYNYSTDGGNTWLTNPITHTGYVTPPSPGPIPVIMAGTPANPFELMIVYRTHVDLKSSRTTNQTPSAGNWSTPILVSGTNSNSNNPSLTYRSNSYGYYKLVWDESGKIYHENYYPNSWSGLTFVNSGTYGLVTNESNPTVAVASNNDLHIAWQGTYYNRGVIIASKNLTNVYSLFMNDPAINYYKPTITGHVDGRASLLWYDNQNKIRKAVHNGSSWMEYYIIGTNGTNPSTSIMNPAGGDAKVVWTEDTTSPYTLRLDAATLNKMLLVSNSGSFTENGICVAMPFDYHRIIVFRGPSSNALLSIELGRLNLIDGQGGSFAVDFIPLDESRMYSPTEALDMLETKEFILPSKGSKLSLVRRFKAKNLSSILNNNNLKLELINVATGEILSTFDTVHIRASNSTFTLDDTLYVPVTATIGSSVKVRLKTGYILASNNNIKAAILNLYIDASTVSKQNASSLPFTKPLTYSIEQNYPNPFNPVTRFEYALPSSEHVTLKVYDLLGR